MRYKKISKTDTKISVISIGTWVMGGKNWGEVDDQESIFTIRTAADFGINFIDTAPI
ncbi:aldo/keto reductase [bacterium]|nr:aldo/keto reductase [bacterium]